MNSLQKHSEASVFESFNARPLTPEQVAKTFIESPSFYELLGRCDHRIIGPRGSGKTSLLKMLQPRALESWKSDVAKDVCSRVDYTAVFIPTDISWSKQTSAIVEGLPLNFVNHFRSSAFTTHVLHQLLETFVWRISKPLDISVQPFRRVNIESNKEREIADALAESWKLKPTTRTLIGIKHALSARNVELWSIVQNRLIDSVNDNLPEWLGIDYLSAASYAAELFNDASGEQGGLWALMFDELELAPDWILKGLLTAQRSTYNHFIFKLAISPFDERYEELNKPLQASPNEDYREIRLFYSRKQDAINFSRNLFIQICKEKAFNKIRSVEDVVGNSWLDEELIGNSYKSGSRQYKVFQAALKNDPSFKKYCDYNNITLDNLTTLPEEERASKIRKVYPIVLIRNYFRSVEGSKLGKKQSRRSRKSLEIYTGATSFLTLAEGNPRWIIGMSRLLLQDLDQDKLPLKRSIQAGFVEEAVNKFRARLKTVSMGTSNINKRSNTLLSFLDQIGGFFRHGVIESDFRSQPPLGFTVDSHTEDYIIKAVGRAVNAGALIYVPDKDSLGYLSNIAGKQFRLSYLLATHYSLPLRLGSMISLSKILASSSSAESAQELELF